MKKAREFYTNSTGDTINVLELLDYCYINPNYESISPYDLDKGDKKMDNHDNMKMETSEKGINTETTGEDIDTETSQEEMDTHDKDTDEAETHRSLTSINFEKLKIK